MSDADRATTQAPAAPQGEEGQTPAPEGISALPETAEAAETADAAAAAGDAESTIIRVPGDGGGRRRLLLTGAVAGVSLVIGAAAGAYVGRVTKPPEIADAHPEFAYTGELGPEHWGDLSLATAACAQGAEQSPVDIVPARLLQVDWLEPLKPAYKPTRTRFLQTGYTFQVNYDPGSRLAFGSREYELIQFHFHAPSEHLVAGRPFDMEMHLVHATPDEFQRLAVLAVFIRAGGENRFLARFWDRVTAQKSAAETIIPTQMQDVTEALPANRDYYVYDGSLTTPPCSEPVLWLILKEPIQASAAQIERFAGALGRNARPVQPISGRFIKERTPPA